jgi:hypothetical protein
VIGRIAPESAMPNFIDGATRIPLMGSDKFRFSSELTVCQTFNESTAEKLDGLLSKAEIRQRSRNTFIELDSLFGTQPPRLAGPRDERTP